MKVVLDSCAVEDIEHVHFWISKERPNTASTVVERVLASIERLGDYPEIGRAGIVEGTREWVVPRLPFIVVYEIQRERDQILVLGVFHGAQDRPLE